ncbi:hypothetical protein ABZ468_07960 [Streptomyces sp. NPDC005708]|uniref:hypothetical protein n=1 Tax=Streptomyces sp. NPDC005708 TaxID=3154564 RepID=UPI0033DC1D2C
MTRYGIAIKALPKGAKPFGKKDELQPDGTDPNQDPMADPTADPMAAADPGAPADPSMDPTSDPAGPPPGATDPMADPSAAPDPNAADPTADPGADPNTPTDDARPWSGDQYDQGDETDPAQAFAAYTGSNGEQAWLDQAPDGTLTGWVRDATGQVYRYNDADSWAIDVDDAHMTRTHSRGDDPTGADPSAPPSDPAAGSGRGVQDSMFSGQ